MAYIKLCLFMGTERRLHSFRYLFAGFPGIFCKFSCGSLDFRETLLSFIRICTYTDTEHELFLDWWLISFPRMKGRNFVTAFFEKQTLRVYM